MVRAAPRRDLARRVPPRDRRRGAHGARREDVAGDPLIPRAALHRHDGDRAADREAGLRCLPGVGRRPAARRSCTSRPDRSAPQSARPARRGDQQRADHRRRLRPGRAGEGTRPPGVEPRRRVALPRALREHARDRLRSGCRACLQPRAGVPRGRDQGRGRLGPNAAGQARGDARRVRARRDQRVDQRDAARGRLELPPRDRLHAPRADGLAARLPAAHRAHHADAPAQGSRHRRRLRAEGGDAQRARRLTALLAGRGLLPRRRPRHAGAAAANSTAREAEAHAGAVARSRHARRAAQAERDSARVATGRPEVPRRRRAALLGFDRRSADSLRGAHELRREAHGRTCDEGCAGAVPRNVRRREPQPAVADDGARRPRLDAGRARRLRRPRHARQLGADLGEGPPERDPHAAACNRRRQGRRAGADPLALDVEARTRCAKGPGPQGEPGVPRGQATARCARELPRPPPRGERCEARQHRARASEARRCRAARLC